MFFTFFQFKFRDQFWKKTEHFRIFYQELNGTIQNILFNKSSTKNVKFILYLEQQKIFNEKSIYRKILFKIEQNRII